MAGLPQMIFGDAFQFGVFVVLLVPVNTREIASASCSMTPDSRRSAGNGTLLARCSVSVQLGQSDDHGQRNSFALRFAADQWQSLSPALRFMFSSGSDMRIFTKGDNLTITTPGSAQLYSLIRPRSCTRGERLGTAYR